MRGCRQAADDLSLGEIIMRTHSFRVTAIGNVAKQPELKQKGDRSYLHLCLIGNDYAGPDNPDVVTGLFFTAFGSTANALGKNVRKGDQLIIDAHIRDNSFTDSQTGEAVRSHSFIIDGFRFGAPGREKRAEFIDATTPVGDDEPSTAAAAGKEDLEDDISF
jgi:single-strand DNA-binding protein